MRTTFLALFLVIALGLFGAEPPYQRNFVTTNNLLTIALSDTGANVLWGWDDTDNQARPFTLGAGLTYTHASHTVDVSGAYVTNNDTRNLTFLGNLDVAGQLNAAHGTLVMSTGTVSVATSASTNQFGPNWSYVFTDAPIGSETNNTLVVTNAFHVFISFGAAMSSNASGAGTMSCHVTTNGVICPVIRIEALAAGATAFETGFKEFSISLPAGCRVGLAFGQTVAQSINVRNACLNIKGAN